MCSSVGNVDNNDQPQAVEVEKPVQLLESTPSRLSNNEVFVGTKDLVDGALWTKQTRELVLKLKRNWDR